MKRLYLSVLSFIFILGILVQPGCKIFDDLVKDDPFTLTVKLGDGVSGVPSEGVYNYEKDQTVTYSYTTTSEYEGLNVALDGITIADSGFISMNSNHTLDISAVYDISDVWVGWHAEGPNGEDVHYRIELTFSGGGITGTITGTEGAGGGWIVSGTYTLDGLSIEFKLDGSVRENPIFKGDIENFNEMKGTYSASFGDTGIWVLERQ